MKSLRRLVAAEPVQMPEFCLDRFQEAVLANLYLEFFLIYCRVLITPKFSVLSTGQLEQGEIDEIDSILAGHRDRIEHLRRYVVVNLALYTALLETNSYYLRLNDNLLICRFVPVVKSSDDFVLKLYTIARDDLISDYKDKIYLGRDQISIRSLHRPYYGMTNTGTTMNEQLAKLRERLDRMVPVDETELYRREHLADLAETVTELDLRINELVDTFPLSVLTHSPDVATLLEANNCFREVKHLLIEIRDTLGEMERMLLAEGHPRAARYVTKMRKDAANTINFIMCKVNGRISNVVNRIDALAFFQAEAGVGT